MRAIGTLVMMMEGPSNSVQDMLSATLLKELLRKQGVLRKVNFFFWDPQLLA